MAQIEIDPKLLPASVLIDTTVALRGYGVFPNDPRSPACVAFVDACVKYGVQVLIAAPTLAEVLRGGATRPIPRVQNVEIVAFDDAAALVLGTKFPQTTLQEISQQTGLTLTYVKYDALIVACAVRYNAACFVCLDERQGKLAARVNLRVAGPHDFIAAQANLNF